MQLKKTCPNKSKLEGEISSNETKDVNDTEDEKNDKKRKPEESPPGKAAPQKARDDDQEAEFKTSAGITK